LVVKSDAGEDSTDVVVQVHHSVMDGSGLAVFSEDLFRIYGEFVGKSPLKEGATRDPKALLKREKVGFNLFGYMKNFISLTDTTYRFLFMKANPVCPQYPREAGTPKPNRVSPRDDVALKTLTPEETTRIRSRAKSLGVTVNDLLVAAFAMALDRLREGLGQPVAARWRLAIPINLRQEKHRDCPACNIVTMAFLDLPARARKSERAALRLANRRLNAIKKNYHKYFLGLALGNGERTAKLIGKDLRFFLHSDAVRASATFTNLGVIFPKYPAKTPDGKVLVGDATMEFCDDFIPIRRNSSISLAGFTYAGRLRFGLRFDPKQTPADAAARFLDDLSDLAVNGEWE
ncbi:MAG: hypothetical protein HUK22_02890, partial [Thermoguttaceae bacterium]|nr:hypothetical protein [Thermoguttaceae bacterium]